MLCIELTKRHCAPNRRALHAHCAPSTCALCTLYAPTMRPLCALYAPTMCPRIDRQQATWIGGHRHLVCPAFGITERQDVVCRFVVGPGIREACLCVMCDTITRLPDLSTFIGGVCI